MNQVILVSHPKGEPRVSDFALSDAPMPECGPNEILIKTLWLSLDPMIRFTLDEKLITGVAKVELGEPIYGAAISRVVQSNHKSFAPGDYVNARSGWREYASINPDTIFMGVQKVDPDLTPMSAALGLAGMPGQTAHAAVIEIGRVKAGETVAISAAAGAVGLISGQLAKMLGARAVGIAGGPEKCAKLVELGFDACVDYRAPDFDQQLAAACPDKIDCYVENVGGDLSLAVMAQMKHRSRMAMCGYIAYHGVGMLGPGPDRLPGFLRLINSRMMEVRGFGGTMEAGTEGLVEMARWLKEGKLRNIETVVDGFQNAAEAFAGKFGRNDHVGKVVVRVAADD